MNIFQEIMDFDKREMARLYAEYLSTDWEPRVRQVVVRERRWDVIIESMEDRCRPPTFQERMESERREMERICYSYSQNH